MDQRKSSMDKKIPKESSIWQRLLMAHLQNHFRIKVESKFILVSQSTNLPEQLIRRMRSEPNTRNS